jgi:hypothetical protein
MRKINWNVIFGILVTCAFFAFLLIRLDFFQKIPKPQTNIQISSAQKEQDTWMNIYQNKKKIGFVHRMMTKTDEKVHFNEKVLMEINSMGVTQALNLSTEGDLNPDMTLDSFKFTLNSSLFSFSARGNVAGNKLILFTGLPGSEEKTEIPLKDIPSISGSIYDKAFQSGLTKDASGNFSVFDPSTMSVRAIKVTRQADEIISVMGERILTGKYCADFMGAQNCAWLDKDGNVLKETGIIGLSMEKTSKEKALQGIARGGGVDVTQLASVESNVEISDPPKLSEIKIRVSGINDPLFLDGGRQSYRQNILTVTREKMEPSSGVNKKLPIYVSAFLKPSALIQSNDPQIKAQLEKIVKPEDSPRQKAEKIISWLYKNIEKRPALSVPNALEVLKNKTGDCNEHTVLAVALLRAAGIPAQSEAGLVYLRGRFYYHAWCVLYLDKWITADAVFNQFPADVTHIRLVRGDSAEQLGIMGVIGKIKLEVLEQKK